MAIIAMMPSDAKGGSVLNKTGYNPLNVGQRCSPGNCWSLCNKPWRGSRARGYRPAFSDGGLGVED